MGSYPLWEEVELIGTVLVIYCCITTHPKA